jgi:hypothetical protein
MAADPEPISRLGELVALRLEALAPVSLAALTSGPAPEAGAAIVALLYAHASAIVAWLGTAGEGTEGPAAGWASQPAQVLRRGLVRWLQQRNQFLQVDPRGARELDGLCGAALAEVAALLATAPAPSAIADGLRAVIDRLRPRLAAFVHARLGAAPRDVVCGHYAPSLQLEVLGLAPDGDGDHAAALADPILDIGCGADAALVRFLRAAGRDAVGIDRDAPADVATAADWLTYAYGADRWATLISHLGFSLHFLHHHHRAAPAAAAYARTYMAMLRSLRVGGRFAYAPALPFLEPLLPPAYRVERVPLADALQTPAVEAAQAATGLPLEHASHVIRLR